jgi:hypothetical protein
MVFTRRLTASAVNGPPRSVSKMTSALAVLRLITSSYNDDRVRICVEWRALWHFRLKAAPFSLFAAFTRAPSHRLPQGLELHARSLAMSNYSRDSRSAKRSFGVSLHGSNLEPLMSALGQKRTWRRFEPMSALPPKADIG